MTAHVHHIKDGRFVCTAAPEARCRNYPDCDCETWTLDLHGEKPAAGHEPVPQGECWIKPWLDAVELGDTYAGDDSHGMHFPDGPVDHEWQGDYLTWQYADATRPEWNEDDE